MPPPRDRLADMKENAYIEEGDDFEINVDDDGPVKDFLKEIEEIKNNVEKVNAKIEEVKKLQSEILTNPTVDKKQNQQMDDLMAEIKKLANNVRSRLKKIETENEAEEKGKGSVSGELRIKKTQHMTTSRRFVEVMTEYNRIQVGLPLLMHPSRLTETLCRLITESKASKRLLVSWRYQARLPQMRNSSKCWR